MPDAAELGVLAGLELTPLPSSLSRLTQSAVSEHVLELLVFPTLRSLVTCGVALELRPVRYTGIARINRYFVPLR